MCTCVRKNVSGYVVKNRISFYDGGNNSYACCLLHGRLLLDFLFDPEDRGDMFVRNVS
jgi:hypothetical protein